MILQCKYKKPPKMEAYFYNPLFWFWKVSRFR